MNAVFLYIKNMFKVHTERINSIEIQRADIIVIKTIVEDKLIYICDKNRISKDKEFTYEQLIKLKSSNWNYRIHVIDMINASRRLEMDYRDKVIRYITNTPRTYNDNNDFKYYNIRR